jgi:hypothetical protein
MANAYGQSGQGGAVTIGAVGALACTSITLRKAYSNADTTVGSNGWGKLCPIYRDWMIDVEIPSREADASETIVDAFDASAFPANVVDVAIPECVFQLPNGRTYTGYGMLDGEVSVVCAAKDAVRLKFTIKGSDALVQAGA